MSNPIFPSTINVQKVTPHLPFIYDPNAVLTNGPGSITGGWRAYTTNDIQNNTVTLTGNGISVQNVAVTGGFVAVTNVPTVTIGNGVVPVSGNVNITNAIQAVSGVSVVPYLTGIFSPVFTGFSTGQVQIPAGVKGYSISVVSGSAFLQGTLLGQGTLINGGKYGGGFLSSYALNLGASGQGYVFASWET